MSDDKNTQAPPKRKQTIVFFEFGTGPNFTSHPDAVFDFYLNTLCNPFRAPSTIGMPHPKRSFCREVSRNRHFFGDHHKRPNRWFGRERRNPGHLLCASYLAAILGSDSNGACGRITTAMTTSTKSYFLNPAFANHLRDCAHLQ